MVIYLNSIMFITITKKCHINNVCLLSLFYFLKKLILFNINHIYLSLAFAIFPSKTNTFPKKKKQQIS